MWIQINIFKKTKVWKKYRIVAMNIKNRIQIYLKKVWIHLIQIYRKVIKIIKIAVNKRKEIWKQN